METVVRRKFSNAIVWLQIPLIVAAIAVYAYVWAGIRPLLEQRQQLTSDIAGLTTKKDALQKEIESLRSGIESLNYAKVTPQNQVFQLQASAKALPGQKTSDGKPIYRFSIKVNASPEVLQNITKVAYDFNHPTFHQPHREETDRANNFQTHRMGMPLAGGCDSLPQGWGPSSRSLSTCARALGEIGLKTSSKQSYRIRATCRALRFFGDAYLTKIFGVI